MALLLLSPSRRSLIDRSSSKIASRAARAMATTTTTTMEAPPSPDPRPTGAPTTLPLQGHTQRLGASGRPPPSAHPPRAGSSEKPGEVHAAGQPGALRVAVQRRGQHMGRGQPMSARGRGRKSSSSTARRQRLAPAARRSLRRRPFPPVPPMLALPCFASFEDRGHSCARCSHQNTSCRSPVSVLTVRRTTCARGWGLGGSLDAPRTTICGANARFLDDSVEKKCAKSRRRGKRAKCLSLADPYYPPMVSRSVQYRLSGRARQEAIANPCPATPDTASVTTPR
jgi:hypothetical protein